VRHLETLLPQAPLKRPLLGVREAERTWRRANQAVVGPGLHVAVRSGADQLGAGDVGSDATRIAGKQRTAGDGGVRADDEVG